MEGRRLAGDQRRLAGDQWHVFDQERRAEADRHQADADGKTIIGPGEAQARDAQGNRDDARKRRHADQLADAEQGHIGKAEAGRSDTAEGQHHQRRRAGQPMHGANKQGAQRERTLMPVLVL